MFAVKRYSELQEVCVEVVTAIVITFSVCVLQHAVSCDSRRGNAVYDANVAAVLKLSFIKAVISDTCGAQRGTTEYGTSAKIDRYIGVSGTPG